MSEKRFRKLMGFIQDNTCEKGDVDGVMDLSEIEDMLNEQQATINKLQKELASVCVQKSLICDELEILKKVMTDE